MTKNKTFEEIGLLQTIANTAEKLYRQTGDEGYKRQAQGAKNYADKLIRDYCEEYKEKFCKNQP